jgi:hypothetical protein
MTRNWNESVLPGVNSTFSLAGRTGAGAHQTAVDQSSDQLGRQLSGLGTEIYGQNYQQERDRQQNAANQLGGFQMQNQAANQAGQIANQQAGLQANLANQQAGLQANSQNLQAQMANQQAKLQSVNQRLQQATANQDAQMQARLANQQSRLQTGTERLQAQMANQDARLQSVNQRLSQAQSNQQAWMDANRMNQAGQFQNRDMNYQLAALNQQGANQNVQNMMQAGNNLFGYGNAQGQYMNQLAQMAPGLGMADYYDMERLMGVGDMVRNQGNLALNDSMDRFSFYQNRPENQMNNYTAWLNGIPGSSFGTNTQQTQGGGGGFFGGMSDMFNMIGAGKTVWDMFA